MGEQSIPRSKMQNENETKVTKTEKRQMEVEWKMDKSVVNAKYCDIEGRQQK